jgi:hypothetical protein
LLNLYNGKVHTTLQLSQQKFLAITPKVTSIPSLIGVVTFIIQHVIRSKKRRCSRAYHRILLSMSIMDWIWTVKAFVSTWPIPSDVLFVYASVGITQTCTVFGFLGHGSSLSSGSYNGTLPLYFLLVIRYGWSHDRVKSKAKVWIHSIPLTIGWGTALAGLALDLFHPIAWTCWLCTFPVGCGSSTYPCIRGDSETIGKYRRAFFHAELWAVFGFTSVGCTVNDLKGKQPLQDIR